jgi:hypothetical protein
MGVLASSPTRPAEIDSGKVEADKRARLVAHTESQTQAMCDALAPKYQRMLTPERWTGWTTS